MKYSLILITLLFSFNALTCVDGSGYMPDNSMKRSIGQKSVNGMTKEKFNSIIDEISAVYKPIIKAKGKRLVVKRKWSNDTVNASAIQIFGMWVVNMYGGLARHEDVSADGFALVMCHELGHHLGGAPKISSGRGWASNEGQSDYFAALKCFRKVYGSDDNVSLMENVEVEQTVETKCSEKFTLANDVALCKRTAIAAKGLAKLLNRGAPVSFDSPSTSVVARTDDKHPAGQCRLDTYFHGALCDKDIRDEVSRTDAAEGVCTRTEGYEEGTRRTCWYKVPSQI